MLRLFTHTFVDDPSTAKHLTKRKGNSPLSVRAIERTLECGDAKMKWCTSAVITPAELRGSRTCVLTGKSCVLGQGMVSTISGARHLAFPPTLTAKQIHLLRNLRYADLQHEFCTASHRYIRKIRRGIYCILYVMNSVWYPRLQH